MIDQQAPLPEPDWAPGQLPVGYRETVPVGPYARPDAQQIDVQGAFGEAKYPYLGSVREDLSAQIDGVTNIFSTDRAFLPGSLEVWLDGVYQGVAPRHYSEVGTQSLILELVPRVGERLTVAYSVAPGPVPEREDLTDQINGVTDTFTVSAPFAPGTVRLWVDGVHQGVQPRHFIEILPNQVQFLDYTPIVGEEAVVWYLPL